MSEVSGKLTSSCRTMAAAIAITWGVSLLSLADSDSDLPFELPDGFEVRLAAEDAMAHDALCMTLDSLGRPVVSGPGYVRTLIDDDGDGDFDRFVTWSDLPKQGAQGLFAEAGRLLWVGDGGLWQSIDRDGDLRGDGPPTRLLNLPTGGEHDAHALKKGPDGWWYLIAGNFAANIQSINNAAHPAVHRPRAGTLWRIHPNFSEAGAWAHGFRNAYDFDFLPNGQVITYDSDEEREVALPWYRSTRVMVIAPGSDAGWVHSAFVDPEFRVTMPQVISRHGRGSPTGVAVYRHRIFPAKYHDAAFVLDWTFGRVIAVYPQPSKPSDPTSSPVRFMAETFMQPSGTLGFAPTDLCVTPSGELLVCVGGRGTLGGVYRVRFRGLTDTAAVETAASENGEASIGPKEAEGIEGSPSHPLAAGSSLLAILDAPSPWESWSVARWLPRLQQVGLDQLSEFLREVPRLEGSEATRDGERRRRALQLIAYTQQPLDQALLESLLQSPSEVTRGAAWWWVGHGRHTISREVGDRYANESTGWPAAASKDWSPWDRLLGGRWHQSRYEGLGMNGWTIVPTALDPELDWLQQTAIRQSQLWAMAQHWRRDTRGTSSKAGESASHSLDERIAKRLFDLGPPSIDSGIMDALAAESTARKMPTDVAALMERITVLQAALGDLRTQVPLQKSPPQTHAIDSYRGLYSRKVPENVREGWTQWCMKVAELVPVRDRFLIEAEALRLMAMLEPASSAAIDHCLANIDQESHPTSDLHRLLSLTQCRGKRSPDQSKATAMALPSVLAKTRTLSLNTDSRWNARLEEMYRLLVERDPALPRALLAVAPPMTEDILFWIEWSPTEIVTEARRLCIADLIARPTSDWPSSFLRFATREAIDAQLLAKLRREGLPQDRLLAIELLARSPGMEDYNFFLSELAGTSRGAWPLAWKGLARLPISSAEEEFRTLANLWSRLQQAPMGEMGTRELTSRLRGAAIKLRFPDPPREDRWERWLPFLLQHLDPTDRDLVQAAAGPPPDWLPLVRHAATLQGHAERGKELFQRVKCGQCHGGGTPLGPDLAGISRRFSQEDLFRSIFEPNRDISDRYRAIRVLTIDDEVIVGMKVYESVDGITLQTADGKLARIEQNQIQSRSQSDVSLMPSGLLNGLDASQLADLYAYLRQF